MANGRLSLFRALAVLSACAAPSAGALLKRTNVANELAKLNATLGGRLYFNAPWELPCFSEYNGEPVTPNATACAAIQANYTDPMYRVDFVGQSMMPQWETCQVKSPYSGCLLNSNDPYDTTAYEGVNCQIGNIPEYYIDVQSYTDVQAAMNFSLKTGVNLTVKNKGHDYKGRSTGMGTVALWVSHLNSISYNPEFVPTGCSASSTYDAITIGPGAITEDIYEFADSINRTFIGGYHQTIGAGGGYVLGGGHSILSPVFGLAADRALEFKIVTPDGVYRTASQCENSDLFWALRGGGGSTWGVVIESTHELAPQVTLQVASISFAGNTNLINLAEWYSLLVNETYKWGKEGWGGHITVGTIIYVNPLMNNSAANASMQAAAEFAISQGGTAIVEELPSYLTFFNKYVTYAEAAVGPEITLGTRLLTTSLFETEEGRALLSGVITEVLPFAAPYVVQGTPFLYNYTRGATSFTPAWYDSLWHLSVHATWEWNSTVEEIAASYLNVSSHVQLFRDITPTSGAYFNEGDVYEPNHTYSYWGDNYAELLEVKKKYDPNGVMQCWQCVGWEGPSDPLYQCYLPLPQS
ncbi:uncharacterized protein FIBRA_07290 [Fibroporia radiculosa]|uniref:FAD-binding PCMH-type domain-containing protein n=1 Tax=Fibroporia radiculosa TaxID=599839 RepID=J4GE10_9APHY|nr:uncharacterized protein FIBRA_07290 [Fibroporia radiculosa]CCM05083.1 predicted protein [Fibroporia radiculosa]